jgi:hypothetical protein
VKNLLIYVNPGGFDDESAKFIKIQVENSLELGWKPEDIILITDFPYEYSGIKATIVTKGYCSIKKEASKITTIVHLFDIRFFKENTLYWSHDLDAYQLEPITESEIDLEGANLGLTDYGRKPNWQMGSFFFKKPAEDIFRAIAARIAPGLDENRHERHDETAIQYLTDNNTNGINSRIKRLNNTYNFGMRRVDFCYEKAIKPLKVLHFHPFHPRNKGLNTLGIAIHGKNSLGFPLMNERLIKIFNKYGYH